MTPTVPGAVTCKDHLNNGGALQTDCFGNLGAGQGVTVTVVFTGVTAATVKGEGTGRSDGQGHGVPGETNNHIVLIINKQP